MKRLKKWQLNTIIVASVLVILATIALTVWAVVFRQKDIIESYADITDYKPLKWYVGNEMLDGTNKVSVKTLFGGRGDENASYRVGDATIINVQGDTATVRKNGITNVTITSGGSSEVFDIEVIDGVNAFRYVDLLDIAAANKTICQQSDIKLTDSISTPANHQNIELYNDYFGNGFKLISSKEIITGYYESIKRGGDAYYNRLIQAKTEDITIQDLYVIGQEVAKNESFTLSDFGKAGMLISFEGSADNKVSGSIVNCVIENAQRPIFINAADVLVKGNFIRNAADACISIESNINGATNVTLENNVIVNAVVAGVLSWTYKTGFPDENFANITINGFLDIYNWKDTRTAQIMPESEGISGMVNPQIPETLNSDKYQHYFYKEGDLKFIHCGIIVTATGEAKANKTKINGFADFGYEERDFPLPGFVTKFGMSYCVVYGYGAGENPAIKPNENPLANDKIFDELREGRTQRQN